MGIKPSSSHLVQRAHEEGFPSSFLLIEIKIRLPAEGPCSGSVVVRRGRSGQIVKIECLYQGVSNADGGIFYITCEGKKGENQGAVCVGGEGLEAGLKSGGGGGVEQG